MIDYNFTVDMQNMSQEDALSMLPEGMKNILKTSGDTLQVYKIAHPGKSNTYFPGIGKRILKWAKQSIAKLAEYVTEGIPVFHNHAETNSHSGRNKIGEIIKKYLDSEYNLFAIIRKYKKFANLETDVASFEGPLLVARETVENSEQLEINPSQVGGVTGLALASRKKDGEPAFANANVQLSMQMLDRSKTIMTKEELVAKVKELGLIATDIFQVNDLLSEKPIKDEFDKRKGQENLYNENLRLKNQIEELKLKHTTELQELQDNLWKHDIISAFNEEMKSDNRKQLDERQQKYLNHLFKDPKEISLITKEDTPETCIAQWIDNSLKRLNALDEALATNKENTKKENESQQSIIKTEIPDSLKNLPGYFESNNFGPDGFLKQE